MEKHILEKLLDEGLSIREVAKKEGKSYSSIRYWMSKYSLKSKHIIRKRWTDEQLIHAIPKNISLRGVILELGLDPRGSNYKTIKNRIRFLQLDISHFRGQKWSKGISNGRGRPLDDYLVLDGPSISSTDLKDRLVREGLLQVECSICGLGPLWKDKILVMRIDHINGYPSDNRIENLRLVCPNCDSQLPTFCRGYKGLRSRKDAGN